MLWRQVNQIFLLFKFYSEGCELNQKLLNDPKFSHHSHKTSGPEIIINQGSNLQPDC